MGSFPDACEQAGLSQHQASAARLAALGFHYSEIGARLDLADYRATRQILRNAAIKLERSETDYLRQVRQMRRDLLQCMKRGRLADDRTLWGVTPAHSIATHLPAAKPYGTVAEDCLPDARQRPEAFLRTLYHLLAREGLAA